MYAYPSPPHTTPQTAVEPPFVGQTLKEAGGPLTALVAGLVLVVLGAAARADDEILQTPQTESSNPAFLLKGGQFQSTTSYGYDHQTGDVVGSTVANDRSVELTEQRLTEQLKYGITDRFDVYVQSTFVPSDHRRATFADGTVSSFNSSGFNDPIFGARYRALGQDRSYVNLDLGAAFAPNLVSGTLPTALHNGAVANGGQEVLLTLAASRIWPTFTVVGTLGANHLGLRTEESQSSSVVETIQPYWQYYSRLDAYQRFSEHLSAIAALEYTVQPTESILTAGGLEETVKPGNQTSVIAGITYDFRPGMFLRLQDQYVIFANGADNYPTVLSFNTISSSFRQNGVALIFSVIF